MEKENTSNGNGMIFRSWEQRTLIEKVKIQKSKFKRSKVKIQNRQVIKKRSGEQEMQHSYYMINKPYGMESQFIANYPANLLGDLDFDFPEGIHAIGRLDKYSEGLLLLSTNKKITRLLFQGSVPHTRNYAVQVKHKVDSAGLERLRNGVSIVIKGGVDYVTPVCEVKVTEPAFNFPSPITLSPFQATTWLEIKLTEGKYHQVRKMVRVAGHRCLRLVRTSIEDIELGDLLPGEVKEVEESDFFRLLKI